MFNLLFFLYFPEIEAYVIDIRSLLFTNLGNCFQFPSKYHVCCISQILIGGIFIFILLNVFKFPLRNLTDEVPRSILFNFQIFEGSSNDFPATDF